MGLNPKNIMKKLLSSIILIVFATVSVVMGKSYDIDYIRNVKSAWRYDPYTKFNDIDTVKFGSWYQTNETDKEPVEWFVLKKEKGKALLISKFMLFSSKFNSAKYGGNYTWENSLLRKNLNENFFYEIFNDNEQSRVLDTTVTPEFNSKLDDPNYPENETIDKMFILSKLQLWKYFGNWYENKGLRGISARKTEFLIKNDYSKVYSSYWVRTRTSISPAKYNVFDNDLTDWDVSLYHGVRPAIWVSSENLLYDEEIDFDSWKKETNNINGDEQESTTKSNSTEETAAEETTSREVIVSETTIKETSKSKNNENIIETTTRNKIVSEETTKKEDIKRKDYNKTKNIWMYWYIDGNTIHFSSKESKTNHDDKGIYYKTAFNTKSNGECFDNDGNMIGPSAEQRKMITKAIFDDKIDALYCSGLFNHYENLIEIENLKYLNTKNVKSMGTMFQHCDSLLSIDLSNFDTKNVTSMGAMFSYCKSLIELDLSKFDTRNVKDMGGMFNHCEKLKQINLKNFNTNNVTKMMQMFCRCNVLTNLDLSSFNTKNVKTMSNMFAECTNLKTIYVSKQFSTNNVSGKDSDGNDAAGDIFENCISLVGGNETKFNKDHTDKEYARIDTSTAPGYFTLK